MDPEFYTRTTVSVFFSRAPMGYLHKRDFWIRFSKISRYIPPCCSEKFFFTLPEFLLSFGQYNEIARIVTFIALNTDFPNCFENFGRKRIMK